MKITIFTLLLLVFVIPFIPLSGQEQTPGPNEAAVRIYVVDPSFVPVENLTVVIKNTGSGESHELLTNRLGIAEIIVRSGVTYSVEVGQPPKISEIDIPSGETNVRKMVVYSGRRPEKNSDKTPVEGSNDTRQNGTGASTTGQATSYPAGRFLSPEARVNMIESRAENASREIESDLTWFYRDKQEVNATFMRFRDIWKDKVIVVDVTGSMDRYVDQVLVWMAMQLSENEANRYIFFNDGDDTPDSDKVAGETGGLYSVNSTDIDQVMKTLYIAEKAGRGGDVPENDLEALLYSTRYMGSNSELILIADNTSPVRDAALLSRLDVPVRIILCGVTGEVTTAYLDIAYHTGGSIHTIEEDIMNLREIVDRDKLIKINNRIYRLRSGKFVSAGN